MSTESQILSQGESPPVGTDMTQVFLPQEARLVRLVVP